MCVGAVCGARFPQCVMCRSAQRAVVLALCQHTLRSLRVAHPVACAQNAACWYGGSGAGGTGVSCGVLILSDDLIADVHVFRKKGKLIHGESRYTGLYVRTRPHPYQLSCGCSRSGKSSSSRSWGPKRSGSSSPSRRGRVSSPNTNATSPESTSSA